MGGLFHYNNQIFQFINKLLDFILLSILWFLCCIPIVTIGASTTALYYVTFRIAKEEESYIARNFFHSFKSNLKQATLLFIPLLIIGNLLFFSLAFWFSIGSGVGTLIGIVLSFFSIFYIIILLYVFPLLSKFENTLKQTIKNSLLIALANINKTLIIALLTATFLLIIYFIPSSLLIMIFFGFAFLCYINSFIFLKIFDQYIPEEKDCEQNT